MVELYAHQSEASRKLSNGKILVGGVGSGKSITALDYYIRNEDPRPIYVITTARKRDSGDWEDEAAQFSISTDPKFDRHGTLRVDSWNNIKRYVDTKGAFFIFDEQRLVGSGAWVRAFYKIAKQNRWILLSATPGDDWLDYIPVFVANGFYKNQTQFKHEHTVFSYYGRYPKLERYLNTKKLERLRKQILVEMPFKRHTTRHMHEIEVEYDRSKFKRTIRTRQDPDTGDPYMDISGLMHGLRRIGSTDPSRAAALRELMERHDRLIVFYNFDYELEILRQIGKDAKVVTREWNGHKHEPVPSDEAWLYLVQYVAGAEAWNCTTTDSMVFWSLTYSYKNFEQAQGRIDRLNTPYTDLHYYVLYNASPVDRAVRRALGNKKNFNEKAFFGKVKM